MTDEREQEIRERLEAATEQTIGICLDVDDLRFLLDRLAEQRQRAEVAERAAPCQRGNRTYVAQDPNGGWYGDAIGVMQNSDPTRTREQALEWVVERINHVAEQECPIHSDYREWMRLAHEREAEVARLRTQVQAAREALVHQIADLHQGSRRPCPTCERSRKTLGIDTLGCGRPQPTEATLDAALSSLGKEASE